MPRRSYPRLVETGASTERPPSRADRRRDRQRDLDEFALKLPRDARGATPSPFSHHLPALRRGLFFMAAAVSLIAPMAIAAHHADAEMTLARCWPLDLSAVSPHPMVSPVPRVDGSVR